MRKIIIACVMIIIVLSACDARTEKSSKARTPIIADSPTTGVDKTVIPDTIHTPKVLPSSSGISIDQLSHVTMEDEMAVRKMIVAHFNAISEHDDASAYGMLSAAMTAYYSKHDAEKEHFGIESLKMISIEPYLLLQEPQVNSDKPTVHFVVDLDIIPNSYGAWGKGSNKRFVGVIKEQSTWKINALATSPEIYVTGTGQDAQASLVTDLLVTWSPNHQMAAYLKGNPEDHFGEAYLWKVKEDRPVQITNGSMPIMYFSWSADSKFVLVDSGTSPIRFGQLITSKTIRNVLSYYYMGKSIFSPDSKNLAIGFQSGLKIPNSPVDPDDAFNLSVFHLDTLKLEHLLLTENAHYSYLPQLWNDNQNISYTRIDNIHDMKREEGHYKFQE